jgi:acyl-CoA thioester hydrolase
MRAKSAFLAHVRVRFNECDPLGHVNNAVYLGYLEQAAIDHAAAVGWPASRLQAEIGAVFVARRHEIDFLRPAFENDVLEILTWPESLSGARAMRAYRIRRIEATPGSLPPDHLVDSAEAAVVNTSNTVVTARTAWAFADVSRGRPVRIPQTLIGDFLADDE